ncbi:MAG: NADP-dependent phosphogluconate dehydrogenase [Rhizobiaceae bacterium]|nr:NADP-dependent phosphogluconate dehydrogenase [Rhizobiaceae bacterium]MCV0405171.1 NADP-dependent phosphogluconate dehydrogenase [Rhizobiaceae bacterium]
MRAQIGLVGLGVMGSNLALNIAEKGHAVAVFNRTTKRTGAFFENAGDLRERIVPCASLEEFVAQIAPPRPIILMVPAGEAVDQQIAQLRPLLSDGDIVIDAGNANFRDTVRRIAELDDTGLSFIGMGVSGGEDGARHGPSIMVGGTPEGYARIEPVLTSIAARYDDEPCAALVGPGGAGHFVKTVHNGIEYADMQMIAEIYGLLRDAAGMEAGAIGDLFARWNEGRLESYLVEITAEVLRTADPATGRPIVDLIVDSAGQKGTGRWAVIEAQMMGVPATAIEAAVAARVVSSLRSERARAAQAYPDRPARLDAARARAMKDDLEMALLAGKIAAYAQGFAVMDAASREFGWSVPLGTVARIWRAGCIIRSQFLGRIAEAYEGTDEPANLLLAPAFVEMMTRSAPALRRVVALAAETATPAPALSAALAYFDGWRQARGTANLIQGQRDFFGAHGFRRDDVEGEQHGPWAS